ncbi:MAG TPA: TIGR03013 family XrtA/PEP-CTERM system glycosyltransferase [Candidatus Angelobacter sp.]|jgi:sugar transferase (PEP-CTERM system associated)|nr:TIGR03013 family XrtA/PEP-CTERM system glycosyltransferase [Candidatus Angelobacter sp.]
MPRIGGQKIPTKIVVLLLSESVLIILGLAMATWLRFLSSHWEYAGAHTLTRFITVVCVCILALYYNDLYDLQSMDTKARLLAALLQALGLACIVLALIYYAAPDLSLGRGIAALAVPTIFTLVFSWRWLLEKKGFFFLRAPERVLIVGTGATGIELTREICSRPDLNLKVMGFLDEHGENIGKSLVNPGIVGGLSDLERLVEAQNIDRVVMSLKEKRGLMPYKELLRLKFAGVAVEDAHTLFENVSGRIALERLSPSWLIFSDGFRKSRFVLAVKRATDVVASLIGIALTVPVMGLTALAILLETGRPILFRQKRVGLNGEVFEILKFRSMRQDSENSGPKWAADGDSRITRVGAFIRKYRFDELPQFFNILHGEMSLVGPRPEQPYFCEMLEAKLPFFAQRHTVRPGVTGWAQIKYQYGSSVEDAKRKLELDLFYIKHLSVSLDLAIIFETVKVILLGKGAK